MNSITKKLGLCEGRHEIKDIEGYIFPMELDPTNFQKMNDIVHKKLKHITSLQLYVTGLTVALTTVINYCIMNNISLTLYHYDRVTGEYYAQTILSDYWRSCLVEGGYI